jgi:hypothetical protein
VQFWFIYSSDFEDVEGRWIEEVERNEGCDPNSLVNARNTSAQTEKKSFKK